MTHITPFNFDGEVNRTMNSTDLLDVINRERIAFGEEAARRNHFSDRVKDELEGDYYQILVVKNPNGTTSETFELTLDQCMLVAMRESKGVRRNVLAQLKAKQTAAPAATHPLAPVSVAVQLAATIAQAMRLPKSGLVGLMQKAVSLCAPELLPIVPAYGIDAPGSEASSRPTASASALLKESGHTISAAAFNKLLASAGYIEQLTRPASKGGTKKFWSVTDKGAAFGKNLTSAQNSRETQPHWYASTFGQLLDVVSTAA